MKAKEIEKENKILRLISSPRLRSLESKSSSKYAKSKPRPRFSDTINCRPMFNPIAGP